MESACQAGNLQRVQGLHRQGVSLTTADNNGLQPIHYAAANGHLDIVQWLHGQGVDVAAALTPGGPFAGRTPAALARLYGHDDVANWLAVANRSTASDEAEAAPSVEMKQEGDDEGDGDAPSPSAGSPLVAALLEKTAATAAEAEVMSSPSAQPAESSKTLVTEVRHNDEA